MKNPIESTIYSMDPHDSTMPHNIFFLLALLNSDLLNWRFSLTSTNNNVGTHELEVLPYPKRLKTSHFEKISDIVKKIINLNEIENFESFDRKSSELLKSLNNEIYRVYELSAEEIAIVEGNDMRR